MAGKKYSLTKTPNSNATAMHAYFMPILWVQHYIAGYSCLGTAKLNVDFAPVCGIRWTLSKKDWPLQLRS